MKKNHTGTIENIKEINSSVYLLEFSSPTLDNIMPGEYVSILCEGKTLRRPFGVADFNDGKITVLIKKRGDGTKYLSTLKKGDKIEFCAPLGNTFTLENKKTLLLGAGIGVAPLFYLNKKLKECGAMTYFAAGFLGVNDIVDSLPRPLRERAGVRGTLDFISTDDGSNENKGSICDYLDKIIEDFKPEKIVSCAPTPVLKYVAQSASKHGITSEIAMEKTMACGIGVCRGCVIKVKKDGEVKNATVCKDGPVFKGEEVVWA